MKQEHVASSTTNHDSAIGDLLRISATGIHTHNHISVMAGSTKCSFEFVMYKKKKAISTNPAQNT